MAITPFPTINPSGSTGGIISGFAVRIIELLLILGGALAVFMLILAGIRYITAAGNADAAKKARGSIVHALIGVVLIVSAFVLVRLVAGLGTGIEAQL